MRVSRITVLLVSLLAVVPAAASAAQQPGQPTSGPGGSDYRHAGVRVTAGGSGADAWYVFEPARPAPASAPLAVVTHGYGEYSGNAMNGAIARHTARKGNVVIYTRWQTGIAQPCPGPYDIEPCIASEVAGIKGALRYLRTHRDHVQPQLHRASYFGFSFGGIVTVDMLSRWKALGLPEPGAIFLDDPHDGGLTGTDEPAVYPDLGGIPSTAKLICHSGAEGVTSEAGKAGASCNAFFDRITSIPAGSKSLTMLSRDDHGSPALSSRHGVCASQWDPASDAQFELALDAYDWGYCWRAWDALRSCAYTATQCEYALGDTPQNRAVGTWSDGTPIVGVQVQSRAPIRPQPSPARVAVPRGRPPVDEPPTGRLTAGTRSRLRGTASDDLGVSVVEVAVARGAMPRTFRRATGRTAWSLRAPRRLAPGRYRAAVRVTDSAGQQTVTTRTFRVRRGIVPVTTGRPRDA